MNLDDLRDVQGRERTTASLQELPESFYADVAAYIEERKAERERLAAETDDPFDSPEVSRLTDEIEAAEGVAEAIYERRVGKVVTQASFAAADMARADDEDGLTAEERALYTDMVERIRENKSRVLDVLAGSTTGEGATEGVESPDTGRSDGATDAGPPTERTSVDAATAMGGPDGGAGSRGDGDGPPLGVEGDPEGGASRGSASDDRAGAGSPEATTAADREAGGDERDGEADRTTVRITRDVGEIFGVDERVYVLEPDDVVSLPAENAAPLIERNAAEPL